MKRWIRLEVWFHIVVVCYLLVDVTHVVLNEKTTNEVKVDILCVKPKDASFCKFLDLQLFFKKKCWAASGWAVLASSLIWPSHQSSKAKGALNGLLFCSNVFPSFISICFLSQILIKQLSRKNYILNENCEIKKSAWLHSHSLLEDVLE